jgi:alanine dehydrogenase
VSGPSTLLLTRADVVALLTLDDCISGVEAAFRSHALGEALPPAVLGFPARDGGFHIKAASLDLGRRYFAVKSNGNFFHNAERYGMPRIQGLILLCDADNGFPLAVMDSIEITILRTGAATAVAAKYLARPDARVATICGCGNQGRVQLRALARVRPLTQVFAFDADPACAARYAEELSAELKIPVTPVRELAPAVRQSSLCVTCTPSRAPLVMREDVSPGTFLAAVGADSSEKQELDPALLAASTVVVDVLDQCAAIGELHHAIEQGVMTRANVHAELGEVIAGRKRGRTSPEQIAIFDSTGTALQDAAAAAVAYERAVEAGVGARMDLLG